MTEKQYGELIMLFDSHLFTISIIIGAVVLIFSLVGFAGIFIGFRWLSYMKRIAKMEIKEYIESENFNEVVRQHLRIQVKSLKEEKKERIETRKQGPVKKKKIYESIFK